MVNYDLTDNIIAYETGELDGAGTVTLFSHLVKTGQAWTLQGSYGRSAKALIDSGFINEDGEISIDVYFTVEGELK